MDTLTFRKARSVDELESLLRLRYRVFSESRLAGFIHPADDGIDVDAFDLKAVHFGLFRGDIDEPVGYLRRVEGRRTEHAGMIEAIVARHPGQHPHVQCETGEGFPLLDYETDWLVLRKVIGQTEACGRRFAEIGRLSLDPTVRSIPTAAFMTSAVIASGLADGFAESAVTVTGTHLRFYERFGFRQMGETRGHLIHGAMMVCVHWKREWLPQQWEAIACEMRDMYLAHGSITMGPTSVVHRKLVA